MCFFAILLFRFGVNRPSGLASSVALRFAESLYSESSWILASTGKHSKEFGSASERAISTVYKRLYQSSTNIAARSTVIRRPMRLQDLNALRQTTSVLKRELLGHRQWTNRNASSLS